LLIDSLLTPIVESTHCNGSEVENVVTEYVFVLLITCFFESETLHKISRQKDKCCYWCCSRPFEAVCHQL